MIERRRIEEMAYRIYRRRRLSEAKLAGIRIEDLPPEMQDAVREFLFLQEQYDRVNRMYQDLKKKRQEIAEPILDLLDQIGERSIIIEDALKRLLKIESYNIKGAENIIDRAIKYLEQYNEAEANAIREAKEAAKAPYRYFRTYKIKVEEGVFDAMAKLYKWLSDKAKAIMKWVKRADDAAEGFLDAVEDLEALA